MFYDTFWPPNIPLYADNAVVYISRKLQAILEYSSIDVLQILLSTYLLKKRAKTALVKFISPTLGINQEQVSWWITNEFRPLINGDYMCTHTHVYACTQRA